MDLHPGEPVLRWRLSGVMPRRPYQESVNDRAENEDTTSTTALRT